MFKAVISLGKGFRIGLEGHQTRWIGVHRLTHPLQHFAIYLLNKH